ncbi:MAG: hypothetical protein L0Z53_15480 [Acidobacteriales bacterium]|nr:hypothetical protein [Terriglobales bacterium]
MPHTALSTPDVGTLLQNKRLNDESKGKQKRQKGQKGAEFLPLLPFLPFLLPSGFLKGRLDFANVS